MQGQREVRKGAPLSSDLILCPTQTSVPSSVCVESGSGGGKVGFPNSAVLPLIACFFCVIMSIASGGKKNMLPNSDSLYSFYFLLCFFAAPKISINVSLHILMLVCRATQSSLQDNLKGVPEFWICFIYHYQHM